MTLYAILYSWSDNETGENGMNATTISYSAAQDYWIEMMTPMQRAIVGEAVGYRAKESMSSALKRRLDFVIANNSAEIIAHQQKLASELPTL